VLGSGPDAGAASIWFSRRCLNLVDWFSMLHRRVPAGGGGCYGCILFTLSSSILWHPVDPSVVQLRHMDSMTSV
jgi:hypothetical protein